MLIVVCYDIANDRRRRKVFKQMKNYGTRVQYSVFECQLSPEQVRAMKARVRPLLKPQEDSVRYYLLCETCRGQAAVQGIGYILKEQPAVFA